MKQRHRWPPRQRGLREVFSQAFEGGVELVGRFVCPGRDLGADAVDQVLADVRQVRELGQQAGGVGKLDLVRAALGGRRVDRAFDPAGGV